MPGPLTGIRVIDLTRALSGPYCTLMLGDMGADVVKVEQPGIGDESRYWGADVTDPQSGGAKPDKAAQSSYFTSVNRNKRSVTLDLKSESGRRVLSQLVRRADVLVENFRPGTMERLGLSYTQANELNASLIYCSISGFGQTGPRATDPAYDIIVQGMGGIQGMTGERDGPPTRVGLPVGDITVGIFAAYAVLAALFARERDSDRNGQWIDTSMLASQVALLTYQAGRLFATGSSPTRNGNSHGPIAPYGTFATSDGYVNVAVSNDSMWRRFCLALDLENLLADARFTSNADRIAYRERHRRPLQDQLHDAIEERLSTLATAEVVGRLRRVEVPVGPIYDLAQVFADPQAEHLELARPTPHPMLPELRTTGFPYRLSETPPEIRLPPPLLGEHTAEILRELGYDELEIERLTADRSATSRPRGGA